MLSEDRSETETASKRRFCECGSEQVRCLSLIHIWALGMDYTEMADKDIAGKDDADSADEQAKQQKITLGDFEFQRDSEGYVESVSLGDQTWTGEAFRSLLHFPSSCFWMKADGTTKTIPLLRQTT